MVTYDNVTRANVGSEVTMDCGADAMDPTLRYSDSAAGYDVTVTEYYVHR